LSVLIFGSADTVPPLLSVSCALANFKSTALSVMLSTGASTSTAIVTLP
jgi:hypothetical protein